MKCPNLVVKPRIKTESGFVNSHRSLPHLFEMSETDRIYHARDVPRESPVSSMTLR